MKYDLKDFTFLILVRVDSIERLENVLIVTELFQKYFDTNITLREASDYNNKILQTLLKRKINYEFIEDRDPILYKTKHFNEMVKAATTSYIAIWDADIIPDKKAIIDCVGKLRGKEADVCYPYDGYCYDVSKAIREMFLKQKNIKCLFRHETKMNYLHDRILVGGAVMMNRKQFIALGGENESHYGWGNDDFDRFYRFRGLELKICRANTPLFHLSHPRYTNSNFSSSISKMISEKEINLIENSSKEELINSINYKPEGY